METYPWVFPTGTGKPLTKSNIERWMRQARDAWDARGDEDRDDDEPEVSWVTPPPHVPAVGGNVAE